MTERAETTLLLATQTVNLKKMCFSANFQISFLSQEDLAQNLNMNPNPRES